MIPCVNGSYLKVIGACSGKLTREIKAVLLHCVDSSDPIIRAAVPSAAQTYLICLCQIQVIPVGDSVVLIPDQSVHIQILIILIQLFQGNGEHHLGFVALNRTGHILYLIPVKFKCILA